jgi:hypothetical protein
MCTDSEGRGNAASSEHSGSVCCLITVVVQRSAYRDQIYGNRTISEAVWPTNKGSLHQEREKAIPGLCDSSYTISRWSLRSNVSEEHLMGPSMSVSLSRFINNGTDVPIVETRCCATITSDRVSATTTYVMWSEERLCNVSAVQTVNFPILLRQYRE